MSREKEDYTWRNRVDKIESWQWNKIRLKHLGTELVRNSNKFKERNRFAMETGKVINKISNRLRRRSKKIQESIRREFLEKELYKQLLDNKFSYLEGLSYE